LTLAAEHKPVMMENEKEANLMILGAEHYYLEGIIIAIKSKRALILNGLTFFLSLLFLAASLF